MTKCLSSPILVTGAGKCRRSVFPFGTCHRIVSAASDVHLKRRRAKILRTTSCRAVVLDPLLSQESSEKRRWCVNRHGIDVEVKRPSASRSRSLTSPWLVRFAGVPPCHTRDQKERSLKANSCGPLGTLVHWLCEAGAKQSSQTKDPGRLRTPRCPPNPAINVLDRLRSSRETCCPLLSQCIR